MVPKTSLGSRPTNSMKSISPAWGQGFSAMSVPSDQNAGQSPAPDGTLIRASMRPYANSFLYCETSRAEV